MALKGGENFKNENKNLALVMLAYGGRCQKEKKRVLVFTVCLVWDLEDMLVMPLHLIRIILWDP